jgi:hypothetical protein
MVIDNFYLYLFHDMVIVELYVYIHIELELAVSNH